MLDYTRYSTPAGFLAVKHSNASQVVAPARVRVADSPITHRFTLERSRLGRTGMLEGYSSASGYAIVRFDQEPLNLEELLLHPECIELEMNDQ